jgi:hypothetical protein
MAMVFSMGHSPPFFALHCWCGTAVNNKDVGFGIHFGLDGTLGPWFRTDINDDLHKLPQRTKLTRGSAHPGDPFRPYAINLACWLSSWSSGVKSALQMKCTNTPKERRGGLQVI